MNTAVLTSVRIVGSYIDARGFRSGAYGLGSISDGSQVFVAESENPCFRTVVDKAKAAGIDTSSYEATLDHWVKTGEGAEFGVQFHR
jgi:hypothetical protein